MKESKGKSYLESKSKKTKFEHYGIKDQVIQLLKDNNFKKPTLVQAESLPITLQTNLKNLCMIVYAYNGAGKTLTYLIPILNALQNITCTGQRLTKDKEHIVWRPQALIIVPTEALLAQIYEYLTAYADFYEVTYKWNLKIGRIYSTYAEPGHIIIGLAKKMQEKLSKTSDFDFSELKWITFDECDKVKEDTLVQFQHMLQFLSNRQVNTSTANLLITSATGEKEGFRKFIQKHLTTHNILQLDSKDENMGLNGVSHYFSKDTNNKDKIIFNLLQKLAKIESRPQVIIFFNEIIQLRSFYALLKKSKDKFVINDPRASQTGKLNLAVDYIHSRCTATCMMGKDHVHPEDCSASKTTRVKKLKNKQIQVLLGTQTIGRGIDVRTVSLVINYSQPEKNKQLSPTAYIHRVGRTGRYSDEGIALTFISNNLFLKLTEQDQKIKFQQMKNEDQIVNLALQCSQNNQKMTEENSKLRYEYE